MTAAKTLLIALCLFSQETRAEHWEEFYSMPSKLFSQLDRDSVASAGKGQFTVQWRTGRSLDAPYFVKQGVVDCATESIELTTSCYVQPDRFLGPDSVTNYATGVRTSGRNEIPLSESDWLERKQFPSSLGPEAELIRLVCQQDYFPVEKRESIAATFQEKIGCGTAPLKDVSLCGKTTDVLETIYTLLMRLNQVQLACKVDDAQVETVIDYLVQGAKECRRLQTRCDLSLIRLHLRGLGLDLARAASKQPCDSFHQSLASAAEATKRRAEINRFVDCIGQKIHALDDRTSPADVIARAAAGACMSESPETNSRMIEIALPAFTASVLMSRQSAARNQPPKRDRSAKATSLQSR